MAEVPDKYRGKKAYGLTFAALVTAAHTRSLCTYTGIAELASLPTTYPQMQKEVGQLLGEISEDEHNAGRPMLSAIVVDKNDGQTGEGFFTLARKLSLLKTDSRSAAIEFLNKEKTAVFEFWK
jgi:hypothetical protein